MFCNKINKLLLTLPKNYPENTEYCQPGILSQHRQPAGLAAEQMFGRTVPLDAPVLWQLIDNIRTQ